MSSYDVRYFILFHLANKQQEQRKKTHLYAYICGEYIVFKVVLMQRTPNVIQLKTAQGT